MQIVGATLLCKFLKQLNSLCSPIRVDFIKESGFRNKDSVVTCALNKHAPGFQGCWLDST